MLFAHGKDQSYQSTHAKKIHILIVFPLGAKRVTFSSFAITQKGVVSFEATPLRKCHVSQMLFKSGISKIEADLLSRISFFETIDFPDVFKLVCPSDVDLA